MAEGVLAQKQVRCDLRISKSEGAQAQVQAILRSRSSNEDVFASPRSRVDYILNISGGHDDKQKKCLQQS